MNTSKLFSDEEIKNQVLHSRDYWNILFPRKPISPFHLLIVPSDSTVKHFDDLNDDQVIALRQLVKMISLKASEKFGQTYVGYNLFSNNGAEAIGQHMDQFHEHIFIRFSDESESPYATMAQGGKWQSSDSRAWLEQRAFLRKLF